MQKTDYSLKLKTTKENLYQYPSHTYKNMQKFFFIFSRQGFSV